MASAAIPILRPTTTDFIPGGTASGTVTPHDSPTKKDKKLCRNVLIYGQCRFEDTGCLFSHDANAPPSPSLASASHAERRRRRSGGETTGDASLHFAPAILRELQALEASSAFIEAPADACPTLLSTATPSSQFSVSSVANAAVFVPNFGGASRSSTPSSPMRQPAVGGAGAQEFVPRQPSAMSEEAQLFTPTGVPGLSSRNTPSLDTGQRQGEIPHEYFNHAMDLAPTPESDWAMMQQQQHQQQHGGDLYDYQAQQLTQNGHDPSGGYYGAHQPQQTFTRHPLQYHLYHPTTTNASSNPSFFLPPSLHQSLTTKSEATHLAPSVDMKLPDDVGGYTGLLPLDKAGGGGGGSSENGWAGYRSWIYKAWKVGPGTGSQGSGDGRVYVLRRIEGFRLQHEAAISVVDKWTRVRHPGLVAVREAFTTRAFGDHSIIFVYDFHPLSQTLYEAHLSPHASLPPNPWSSIPNSSSSRNSPNPFNNRRGGPPPPPQGGGGGGIGLQERVLWSYIVQLGSAIKTVHSQGLAVRGLEANRVVVTGKNRIRIGGCGILDVLAWDGSLPGNYQVRSFSISHKAQDDLLSFGKLIISLACGSPASVHNLPKSVDHIARVYSPDLKNVVLYLLSKPGPRKTIDEVLALMAGRVLDELNSSLVAEDTLETELMRELENGRLVRLLTKFGFINERPEFDHDPRWAETGDRYIIKLFRDYVFHQVDENGRPVTDLSHVITSLNKLDAGVDEKIVLVSRDEQSCLIVSYREVGPNLSHRIDIDLY
ncbi:PAB-dependent poly(A)-specific ribonuclease subunit 3, partial [Phenoliferia sp. Uapishka_3]